MNIVGDWKLAKIRMLFGDDAGTYTREEFIAKVDDEHERREYERMFDTIHRFCEDGWERCLFPIPAEATPEMIEQVKAQGMEIIDRYIVMEKHGWHEENGEIIYESGIEESTGNVDMTELNRIKTEGDYLVINQLFVLSYLERV